MTPPTEIAVELRIIDARLDEVKRCGAVLQRKGQLNGAKALHYYNRVQALEIERDRLLKISKSAVAQKEGDVRSK